MNQLIGLSRQSRATPTDLLAEASGNQDYILDYWTEEVLRQQDELQISTRRDVDSLPCPIAV